MDLLEEHYDDYLAWLYKNSNSIVRRNSSVLYYDCTNFYFECGQPDEDIVDEVTGEVINGLRSKFNNMGGRAFIVTQSIKKLSATLKKAVFNDFDYRLLSDDTPVKIKDMKEFDRYQKDFLFPR